MPDNETVTIYVLFHVLSRHVLFYFEMSLTCFLVFQVTCPSSRVMCLSVYLDHPKCFHLFPLDPHVYLVCVFPCLLARMFFQALEDLGHRCRVDCKAKGVY